MKRRNASLTPFVSPVARLVAVDSKAMKLPPKLMLGATAGPFPSAPPVATDARRVFPVERSRTNTSFVLFVSPLTRFDASESNAT
jgi:hypothetical protein